MLKSLAARIFLTQMCKHISKAYYSITLKSFPICIYCWKGNILENLNLLNFFSEVTLRHNLFKLAENILAEQCIMYFVKV